jgi:diacylglycerol O-acyltransferase / wax synthase
MKRLSLLDALFLYMETPETPMHVASVTIFKPSSPRDDFFARFREHVAARLDLLPSYRRRLEPTPFGIDHPAWVVEDKVDLDYHIRHAALPKPGGMEELRTLIAQLHAVPLDRSRPLWEYHFIEGLENGAFAVYIKVHHSTMDGIAGVATLGVTYDFAPGAEDESLPARIVPPDVEPSDFIELTSTAVGDFIRQGWRAVKSLPGVVRALTKVAPHFGRDARFLYSYVKDMPRTPFNTAISAHRVYATASLLVMGLTRLWAGARAANYLWPFFNTVISNVPGPRQTMYCVGAPATHYFPVSIPYHGCALNMTVQSYLDQLDFGLVACSETVPDA